MTIQSPNRRTGFFNSPSEDTAVVISKAKQLKAHKDEEDDVTYRGHYLDNHLWRIEEVTDHQYGVAFFDRCPVVYMCKNIIQLRSELFDLKFSV